MKRGTGTAARNVDEGAGPLPRRRRRLTEQEWRDACRLLQQEFAPLEEMQRSWLDAALEEEEENVEQGSGRCIGGER